jgi:hypothetical protein
MPGLLRPGCLLPLLRLLGPLRLPWLVCLLRLPRRLRLLLRLHGALSAVALLAGGWAAGAAAQPPLRVQVFIDEQRFAEARRDVPGAVGYRLQPSPAGLRLVPDAAALLQAWKGDEVATNLSLAARRFVPVMLVLDLANESQAPLQVVGSHLRVAASATDPQPLIVAADGFDRSLRLRNHGWGPAEGTTLRFGFGRDAPPERPFVRELGTLGSVQLVVQKELQATLPALARWIEQPPRCPSEDRLPACFEQLVASAAGRPLRTVGVQRGRTVLARLHGELQYRWRDGAGAEQARRQALALDLHLFDFALPPRPPTAAMVRPPEERGFAPIELPADRKAYRVPLPYRPLIPPGQARRFELALLAPKSSHHVFEIVVETAGGDQAVSPPIELDYLLPNADTGETRVLR